MQDGLQGCLGDVGEILEKLADSLEKFGGVEGLSEGAGGTQFERGGKEVHPDGMGPTRNCYDLRGTLLLSKGHERLQSFFAWHQQIEDDKVHRRGIRQLYRRFAVLSLRDLISILFQKSTEHGPNLRFIIDYKNMAHPAFPISPKFAPPIAGPHLTPHPKDSSHPHSA